VNEAVERYFPGPKFLSCLGDSEWLLKEQVRAVGMLSRWVQGSTQPLANVREFILKNTVFGNTLVPKCYSKYFTNLCRYQGWKIPDDRFNLATLNSDACLFHWRPIAFLMTKLTLQKQREFRLMFNKSSEEVNGVKMLSNIELSSQPGGKTVMTKGKAQVRGQEPVAVDMNNNIPLLIKAIDSHMHVDRLATRLTGSPKCQWVGELLSVEGRVKPRNPVDLRGMVAVYCDPETYPEQLPLDPCVRMAQGVHPRKVHHFTVARERHFLSLLSDPRVVALGEMGLDVTEGQVTLKEQEQFLHGHWVKWG